jgi:hypothetical protein
MISYTKLFKERPASGQKETPPAVGGEAREPGGEAVKAEALPEVMKT